MIFRKIYDRRYNFYLPEAGTTGIKGGAAARWNSDAKPHLNARFKPMYSRNTALPPCKPKTTICRAKSIIFCKRTRCAQKFRTPHKSCPRNRHHLTVSPSALRFKSNHLLFFTWRPWVSKVHVNPIDLLSYP